MECLAAKLFDVPRTTLVAGKTPETRKIEKDPILTKDEEDALEE